ncbi:cancer-related nucleoside-triphosphatase isoform X2 [Tachyglossus aculeatus]|uniref:cancer-related nucleoside-triphosphatase isoform X2 n=1 Tax=Tachyglossus aculeatus TaxID=9261 RepID=UPI0018F556BC|nr:cancer-related nucleoside-triphosphatase isoform X2 [Tachyglossus aculeatus]
MARHVFLTGPPGVGKTTLVRKAVGALEAAGVPADGFYTEEVRQAGRRVGFDVVTLSGLRGPLSRVGSDPGPGSRAPRVGQYVVDVASLERLALPMLSPVDAGDGGGTAGKRVCVIDEVGKMELCSEAFVRSVRRVLAAPRLVVLGSIPLPKGRPLGLVEEIRARRDVALFVVTRENRDRILDDIVAAVQGCRD